MDAQSTEGMDKYGTDMATIHRMLKTCQKSFNTSANWNYSLGHMY